jgi:uncharacterized SAM-binding protein YcdF (DUF218 family)
MMRALRSFLASLAVMVALLGIALIGVAAYGGYWLQSPAQQPRRADAIVVLGGDEGDRAARALELFRAGYAPVVVLTGLEYGNAAPPAALTWRAEYLEARGIPRDAIRFEVDSRSTYTEAVNILALMRKEGWRTVIVVSDPPHMRRVSLTWSRVFDGSGLSYVSVASNPEWWSPRDWWKEEKTGAYVIMEYIKLGYYAVKKR